MNQIKNLSTKFLLPLIILIIITSSIIAWNIADSSESHIFDNLDKDITYNLENNKNTLISIYDIMVTQVQSSMNLLKESGLELGTPSLGESVPLLDRMVPDLKLGNTSQIDNFQVVDHIKKIMGGTATLFVKDGENFVRVSTNVTKDNGERAIGTVLDPKGKAIVKIRNGQSFYGAVDILGSPYITGYEPIFDSDDQVIGVWYVGYKATTFKSLAEKIEKARILDNGFIALFDNKEKLLFKSEHISDDSLKAILADSANQNTSWNIIRENIPLWNYSFIAAYPKSDIDEKTSHAKFSVLIYTIIATVIFLGIIYFLVMHLIVRPLKILTAAAEKVKSGNYEIALDIDRQDEFGRLAVMFNKMTESIRHSYSEIKNEIEKTEAEKLKAEQAKNEIENQREYLSSNTKNILTVLELFSKGDLTVSLEEAAEGDIGELKRGLNDSIRNVSGMLSEVINVIQAVLEVKNGITESTENMVLGTELQAQQTTEIAGAVEEMTRTIFDTTKGIASAGSLSKGASQGAREGTQKVHEAKNGMDKIVTASEITGKIITSLANKTEQIGEIAQIIDDIADQTNLLALNAAIEAARAGEQGRGFAVVADEVRKLAERTTKATKEIAETIKAIQMEAKDADASMAGAIGSVKDGMVIIEQVASVLDMIVNSSEKVTDVIMQLSAASEEQSATAEQISKNIVGITTITQETTQGTQLIKKSVEDLNQLTLDLQKLVSRFKLDQTGAGFLSEIQPLRRQY